MKRLRVDTHENRGDPVIGVNYGFVYFNDDLRIGYSHGKVWDVTGTGGWPVVTPKHRLKAEEYLRNLNPPLIELSTEPSVEPEKE